MRVHAQLVDSQHGEEDVGGLLLHELSHGCLALEGAAQQRPVTPGAEVQAGADQAAEGVIPADQRRVEAQLAGGGENAGLPAPGDGRGRVAVGDHELARAPGLGLGDEPAADKRGGMAISVARGSEGVRGDEGLGAEAVELRQMDGGGALVEDQALVEFVEMSHTTRGAPGLAGSRAAGGRSVKEIRLTRTTSATS